MRTEISEAETETETETKSESERELKVHTHCVDCTLWILVKQISETDVFLTLRTNSANDERINECRVTAGEILLTMIHSTRTTTDTSTVWIIISFYWLLRVLC